VVLPPRAVQQGEPALEDCTVIILEAGAPSHVDSWRPWRWCGDSHHCDGDERDEAQCREHANLGAIGQVRWPHPGIRREDSMRIIEGKLPA
jgi:hypothetical protein